MAKFNAKDLAIVIFFGVFVIGAIGIVNAQQALPKGGNSFETAVKLEPGNYQGGSLESKEIEYFYVTGVKSGQEINIKATFTAADIDIGAEAILALYDEDGTELAGKEEGFYEKPASMMISWSHTGKDSDQYYIKAGSGLFKIDSFSLEVSLMGEETVPPKTGKTVPLTGVGGESATKGLNWILILGIAAAIVTVVIVIYFLLKKKK